jgi:GT2 family glycosyltransferase
LIAKESVAVVTIGRNEGDRLSRCLESLAGKSCALIYVDSGSTDDSVVTAQQAGATVLLLDMSRPFTAARARNLGISRVLDRQPKPKYVQVVDGDCVVQPGWLETAHQFLESHPEVALVCGRRRERFPHASIYNLLCDWEWNTPIGQALACGGDALIRLEALTQAGLYDETVIAAEDDELCVRIRAAGWTIWRIDAEMTLHDAAISRFSQWWRRMVRAGHAFAQVGNMHPGYFVAPRRRIWFWAVLLPAATALGFLTNIWIAAVGTTLYMVALIRSFRAFREIGFSVKLAATSSCLLLASKFSNLQGYVTYWWRRAWRSRSTIIEYK